VKKADRLLEVLQLLRRLPKPVTAQRLSEELEVSLRTVYRDIEALRGLRVSIEGEAGVGYILLDDGLLPPLMFTADEVEAISLGLRRVMTLGDDTLTLASENALSKIRAVIPQILQVRVDHGVSHSHSFVAREKIDIDLKELRRAAHEERKIDIVYQDVEGDKTERRLWPLGIVYLEKKDLLIGWCELRQDFRSFRLDRMASMSIADESFRPNRVSYLNRFFERQKQELAGE
jgi:predicted DNA-binding transcriptional regulator YafY